MPTGLWKDFHKYFRKAQTDETPKCIVRANHRPTPCIKETISATVFSTVPKGDIKAFPL